MITSFEYCLNHARARPDNVSGLEMVCEDELVGIAEGVVEAEAALKEIRAQRWGYCMPILGKGNKVEIQITDDAGFKQSVEDEAHHVATIARIRALFLKLQPIFDEISQKLPKLRVPTLKGLKDYETDCSNRVFITETRLKEELADRVTSARARHQTLNDVLADPSWLAYQKEVEEDIARLKGDAEAAQAFISRVEAAMA